VLKLDPQFAGTALVMVVDDRIIDMQAVDVPADGTSVSLPVTEEWGPGAYVTAMLYRPSDATEKRMPARALGLAFADVDPGDRKLDVVLDVARRCVPRAPMSVTVKVPNAKAGEKGLCGGCRRRPRHPQPHQLQDARSGRLVSSASASSAWSPRPLRPADRSHAGQSGRHPVGR
jgi:hypothetical protein